MNGVGKMNHRNIASIIMLCAGAIASICCLVNQFTLLNTLKVTLVVLLLFYVIGVIAAKFIIKINEAANNAYVTKQSDLMNEENENSENEKNENDGLISEEIEADKAVENEDIIALQKDNSKSDTKTNTKASNNRKK